MRTSRALLEVSLPLESATFGRPEVAPAGAPQKSCQRLRDWVPEGLILAGARLRGTALCVSLCKGFRKYPYTRGSWTGNQSDDRSHTQSNLARLDRTGGGNNYAPPEAYEKIGFRGMSVTKQVRIQACED